MVSQSLIRKRINKMSSITFRNTKDVYQFLENGGDAWYTPMIEEYVGMSDPEESLDITELNRWIDTESLSLQEGYEEFHDGD
jgi:hypothetical protein